MVVASGLFFGNVDSGHAAMYHRNNPGTSTMLALEQLEQAADDALDGLVGQPQSAGWEAARMKRTAAMKDIEKRGIVKVYGRHGEPVLETALDPGP
jgi:hypothetical protein